MAKMEINSANLLNTTTQFMVDSNTDTVEFLYNGNTRLGYSTEGYSSDTSTIISVEFAAQTPISSIVMQNHNLKDFTIFFNSVTASSINVTTGNSETSNYYTFNTLSVFSLQFQLDAAQTADTEKSIGEIIISDRILKFERNPSYKDYKPIVYKKQVRHEMPDGGVSLYNIRDKQRTTLKWDFITSDFKDGLKSVFDSGDSFVFIPFPTTTAWDGIANEMVWTGNFDFKYSTNSFAQGYSGSIKMEQTSNE